MPEFGGIGGFAQGAMAANEEALRAKELQIKDFELSSRLQQIDMEKQKFKTEQVQKAFQDSMARMKALGEVVKTIGSGFKPGSALDKAIDMEKAILAQTAEMNGQDPRMAQAAADGVRAYAMQQPNAEAGFTLSPGQQRFDASGKPIAQVPANAAGSEGFTLGPGQQRFGPDGKPIASVPSETATGFGPVNQVATLVTKFLDDGIEPDQIRAILMSMQTSAMTSDPKTAASIAAIANALPRSQQEHKAGQVSRDVTAQQPRIDALTKAGVDPQTAALMVYGKGATSLNVSTDLTGATTTRLQEQALSLPQLITDLESLKNEIDDETVGVWGELYRSGPAAVATQVPVARSLAATLGVTPERVTRAMTTRSRGQTLMGSLANMILQEGSNRLSNQDREFIQEAAGTFGFATTPDVAKKNLTRFLEIARRALSTTTEVLGKGKVAPDKKPQDQGAGEGEIVTAPDGTKWRRRPDGNLEGPI